MEYKINTILPIKFEKIENPPYLNDSRFQAVRCYVAHEKDNYNGSWFDTSVLEKMGKRMAGVPIVGYISANNVNEKDFNGHEERLIIDNNGISIEYLGRAYGCIISNDDVEIVQRQHESGEMRNYLCVIGVLWKMFTDSIEIFDRDDSKAQSMELQEDSISGKFEKDGYYHFEDATVRALCILGEGIQPAMSNSVIEKFSTVDYQNQVKDLLSEINESIKQFSLSNSIDTNTSLEGGEIQKMTKEMEGNHIVDEKLEVIAKYNLTLEQLDFSIDELSIEELEVKLQEFSIQVNQSNEPEIEVNFSATYNQKREALRNALDPIVVRDADNKLVEETYFWVADFDDEFVYVEKDYWTKDNSEFSYGRVKYTFDEVAITATVDMSTWEKMIKVWLTEAENQKIQDERNSFTIMSTDFETLKTKISEYEVTISEQQTSITEFETTVANLTSENTKLQEFKSNIEFESKRIEIEGLIEDFEAVLKDNEEFEQIKKDVADDEKLVGMEYQVLEDKFFALEGKMKHESKKKDKSKKPIAFSRVNVEIDNSDAKSEYGEASKYFPKKDK